MYFPWVGMFEQVRLADVYVNYNDVQFSKGSFTNRVQIKTNMGEGFTWLTVPLKKVKLGDRINEIELDEKKAWRNHHLDLLKQFYKSAPFFKEMMEIVNNLFSEKYLTIGELSQASMEIVFDYFDLKEGKRFYNSSEIPVNGASTQRVSDIVLYLNATKYITGHGAKNYLDHKLFEKNKIEVEYIDYQKKSYPQLFSPFNPYVSILDLIANMGKEGKKNIISTTKKWREFINEPE